MAYKKALVTGVTGQVGSYLVEYLLDKGYQVDGLDRRKSIVNYDNIKHLEDQITIIEGDLTDAFSMYHLIKDGQYHSVYNLAAQSHVHTSFKQPETTLAINAIGVLNLLEAIREYSPHTKFYQASTSELFGIATPPQNEQTPFYPRSPYGVSKLAAHWYVKNYHESYKLKASCGIMFNTESPRRGVNFVTRKITEWVKEYHKACCTDTIPNPLCLGNLNAKRDWSHAKDSVDAIYRVCNQDEYNPNFDGTYKAYTFGSGHAESVRNFVKMALEVAFDMPFDLRFEFLGEGLNEHCIDKVQNRVIVKVSEKFYRPAEVEYLLCDPTLIKTELGWKPQYNLKALVKDMMENKS